MVQRLNLCGTSLLKMKIPEVITPVAFADGITLVIRAKYVEDINNLFDVVFAKNAQWMELVGLKMSEINTESGLTRNRKKFEMTTLVVEEQEITPVYSFISGNDELLLIIFETSSRIRQQKSVVLS